jgi:Domain of unknown function (DUF1992)
MTNRWESAVDRQIREAQEAGEFDRLPGLGRPLPGAGGEYDEDWWVIHEGAGLVKASV